MAVTVYTKPNCVQCDATKRQMDKLGIEYATVDITKDSDAYDLIISKGFQAAPVVITDNDSWSGFNPGKIGGLV